MRDIDHAAMHQITSEARAGKAGPHKVDTRMENCIRRVREGICYNVEIAEIRTLLIEEYTDEEIFLAYKAAQILIDI